MLKKVYLKIDTYVPRAVQIIFLIALLSFGIHLGFIFSAPFADFFNIYISGVFRAILAYLTVWVPFSLAETLIILMPILAVVAIISINRFANGSWRKMIRCMLTVLSILLVIYILFVFLLAPGYRAYSLEDKLGFDTGAVTKDELYETTLLVVDLLNDTADHIDFTASGESLMPYNNISLNSELMKAYKSVSKEYSFIPDVYTRFKPVLLSEPMTYTHIAGVYSFFTGEANVNVNYPDFVNVYTAAHELAHQRGIARENEANFVAYLVCITSDDVYLRYSGYLNMFEYLASALRKASPEYYKDAFSKLDPRVYKELVAYSEFFEKYSDNIASDVSSSINNSYLTGQGTAGTVSYGMVVDLAVAYHKNDISQD